MFSITYILNKIPTAIKSVYLNRLFIHKRQALNFDDVSNSESLKFQPLSISADDQNRESVHYARGCQSILRNYLSDVETSIEYSTDDALRNIDNALLLKAQSVIEVGLRRHNLREELYCQVINMLQGIN